MDNTHSPNFMLEITPIPAFDDNYIWLLRHEQYAIIVDPGDARPAIAALKRKQLELKAILITHHHSDHINGVQALLAYAPCPVYAPSYEQYAFAHHALKEGDVVQVDALGLAFKVMWLPGHTLGHIAYLSQHMLFCGDTLFGAGCGRLFEGTPAQMLSSLNRIKQLPRDTQIYCTHEYTATNIDFALSLEPDNVALQTRKASVSELRKAQQPTLPSTLSLELETNPFLRCHSTQIIQNAGTKTHDELSVFTAIRERRNHY
jgi:hydroxyacylglutathione hydrolase